MGGEPGDVAGGAGAEVGDGSLRESVLLLVGFDLFEGGSAGFDSSVEAGELRGDAELVEPLGVGLPFRP